MVHCKGIQAVGHKHGATPRASASTAHPVARRHSAPFIPAISFIPPRFSTETGLEEKDLIKKIKQTKELKKFLIGTDIVKSIFIKDKLINLITK